MAQCLATSDLLISDCRSHRIGKTVAMFERTFALSGDVADDVWAGRSHDANLMLNARDLASLCRISSKLLRYCVAESSLRLAHPQIY